MASIQLKLSTKADTITGKSEIHIRFSHGRNIDLRAKSKIFIPSEYWNKSTSTIVVPKFRLMTPQQRTLVDDLTIQRDNLAQLQLTIVKAFMEASSLEDVTPDWLNTQIELFHHPEKCKPQEQAVDDIYKLDDDTYTPSLPELFDLFLQRHRLSEVRKGNFRVLKRVIQRYELYLRIIKRDLKYRLDIDQITHKTIRDIEDYMHREYEIAEKYPQIYRKLPDSKKPMRRGANTISDMLTKIRTLYLWAIENEYTTNNPFKTFRIEECVYGTPYYISIEERNKLYHTNLSRHPELAMQRDIFVFQCLIGCRIGDLFKLTKDSIIDDAVEYIPRKTKEGRPLTVRVPLNSIAREILERYANYRGRELLPFTYEQLYNDSIKKMFLAAGLTRTVTVINPTTRDEEKRPLNELASSHLARRTFVGNLYKQVRDPNLVGALSGHKEGSKAFARYRTIDESIKRDLVKMLE